MAQLNWIAFPSFRRNGSDRYELCDAAGACLATVTPKAGAYAVHVRSGLSGHLWFLCFTTSVKAGKAAAMRELGIDGQPSPEQLAAVRAFATRYGRTWKAMLRTAWTDGRYPYYVSSDDRALLQQVRNAYGPAWLTKFKIAK